MRKSRQLFSYHSSLERRLAWLIWSSVKRFGSIKKRGVCSKETRRLSKSAARELRAEKKYELNEEDRAREQYEVLRRNPSGALYQLALMLEPRLQRPPKPVDEAEQEALRRFIKDFRQIKD
jgi:hypothetical protein